MATRFSRILKGTTALIPAYIAAAVGVHANPLDGQVVGGTATITAPDAATLNIHQQTNKAIINWKAFDIGTGETTQFFLPDRNGVTLNRVVAGDHPSQILGTLKSNGTVMVINPDGMLFGPHSVIDVGGLLATTSDIKNDDFMAGNYRFTMGGKATASIINQGKITVKDEGVAALVAPGVRNEGIITARLGKVTLGAANKFTLDFYGDDLINLELKDELTGEVINAATGRPLADRLSNAGTIRADGGMVVLKAATARKVVNSVINNTGVIEANSVGLKNGKIVLGATTKSTKSVADAPVQKVRVSGTLKAAGTKRKEKGGFIAVTGEQIDLVTASIIAEGDAGGGTVLIGGDYLGGSATDEEMKKYGIAREATVIPTATNVSLDDHTTVSVDAVTEGNGGKAVVWSDGTTLSAAKITARGGREGGNGGFIETSGTLLSVLKAADASAANGTAGTWLLDPLDVHIRNAPDFNFNFDFFPDFPGPTVFPTGSGSVISTASLEDALDSGTNVRITTRGTRGSAPGNIYVESDITKSLGGDAFLVLDSARDVIFSSGVDIRSRSGALSLFVTADDGRIIGNDVGRIRTNGGELLFAATDGVNFHSTGDMPDFFSLIVNPSRLPTVNVNVSFDDDIVRFSHNNTTATFPTGGMQLADQTASGGIAIRLFDLNVALKDRAIVIKNDRNWRFRVDEDRAFGAALGNELNHIPEIVSDGRVFITPTAFGFSGIAPVFEIDAPTIDAPDFEKCFGLTCVATGPEGKARIRNYLTPPPTATTIPETNPSLQHELRSPSPTTAIKVDSISTAPRTATFNQQIIDLVLSLGGDYLEASTISQFSKFLSDQIASDLLRQILTDKQFLLLDKVIGKNIVEVLSSGSFKASDFSGGLVSSAGMFLAKKIIDKTIDDVGREFNVDARFLEPTKFVVKTGVETGWFIYAHPELVKAAGPEGVKIVAIGITLKNTISQLFKVVRTAVEVNNINALVDKADENLKVQLIALRNIEEKRRLNGDEIGARKINQLITSLEQTRTEYIRSKPSILRSIILLGF